jgi:hypothetical protein
MHVPISKPGFGGPRTMVGALLAYCRWPCRWKSVCLHSCVVAVGTESVMTLVAHSICHSVPIVRVGFSPHINAAHGMYLSSIKLRTRDSGTIWKQTVLEIVFQANASESSLIFLTKARHADAEMPFWIGKRYSTITGRFSPFESITSMPNVSFFGWTNNTPYVLTLLESSAWDGHPYHQEKHTHFSLVFLCFKKGTTS